MQEALFAYHCSVQKQHNWIHCFISKSSALLNQIFSFRDVSLHLLFLHLFRDVTCIS